MRIKVGADKENLWQEVQKWGKLPSYCSGNGRCGKCKVKVIRGEASISEADRKHLSEKEIEAGYRIACQSRPFTLCEIETEGFQDEGMRVLTVLAEGQKAATQKASGKCGIAVDIGTTTLAFALVDTEGAVIATEQAINHQRSYGADVVSRITAAIKGQEAELTACVRKDVREGICRLLKKGERELSDVNQIVIAGNTTMEQLFFGLPVEELGSYPFSPYTKEFIKTTYRELYPETEDLESKENPDIIGFPCVAGFVGGDITAGLYEVTAAVAREGTISVQNANTKQMLQLFLDIGTNGELACITEDTIIVASTAAGPVFEGGSISCGTACIPGAVYATTIAEDMLECRTIDGKSPIGICGSGIIEAVSDMHTMGLIDRQGSLSESYQKNGYVLARTKEGGELTLTQADIREFQMAKAAVAAGLELITKQSGYEGNIDRIILAGGFGNGLSVSKAIKTGLLPKGTGGKTVSAGNVALKGAVRLLKEGEAGRLQMEKLLSKIKHLQLAECEGFQECYMKHMNFPD